MGGFRPWLEDLRTEGLGPVLSLLLVAMVPADPSALRDQVGAIDAIPTTLVVDRRGKVIKTMVGCSSGRLERELADALKH